MYTKITKCRICQNNDLTEVLDLGMQALTGVFPKHRDQQITQGPLRLVKCSGGPASCGLLQLEHSYDLREMYGLNYGYRSGLNTSMVHHLRGKVEAILRFAEPPKGSLIIDVGSNDSTTLQAYPKTYELIGVDPTGVKFKEYYPPHIGLIPEFFSASTIRDRFGNRKASVITSFSMFYDLENPVGFMRDIKDVLADDGIWVFEQSYLPTMLERNSYDTVCHEHLEYYTLAQIEWMAKAVGLKILDVELNDVNGGSFSVVAAKEEANYSESASVSELRRREKDLALHTLNPYRNFASRVQRCKGELLEFLEQCRRSGARVCGLGASTKGNVLLQYCDIQERHIAKIGEVNAEKFGCYTPGTLIPIVPQDQVLAEKPDYLVVLPWHFRSFFETSESFAGRRLVFPLPKLEVVQL